MDIVGWIKGIVVAANHVTPNGIAALALIMGIVALLVVKRE